jgi:hypothetical protein
MSLLLLFNQPSGGGGGSINASASQNIPDFAQAATTAVIISALENETVPQFGQTAAAAAIIAASEDETVPAFGQAATGTTESPAPVALMPASRVVIVNLGRSLSWPFKDPDDILDYYVDWSNALDEEGDTISSSTWIIPTGITKNSDTKADLVSAIWLSGGTIGQRYSLTNRIVTSGGRTMDQTVKIKIKAK